MDQIAKWAEDGLEILRKRLEAKGSMSRSAYVLVRADPQTGEELTVWGTAFLESPLNTPDDIFFGGVDLVVQRGNGVAVVVAWIDEEYDRGVLTYIFRSLVPGERSRTWRSDFVRVNGRISAGPFAEEFDDPRELLC